jgi:hypothetical protein
MVYTDHRKFPLACRGLEEVRGRLRCERGNFDLDEFNWSTPHQTDHEFRRSDGPRVQIPSNPQVATKGESEKPGY